MICEVTEKHCLHLEFLILSSFSLGSKTHFVQFHYSKLILTDLWCLNKKEKGFVKKLIFNMLDINQSLVQ